jgi:hypothetical protein
MVYQWRLRRIMIYRLDFIRSVKILKVESKFEKHMDKAIKFQGNHWGVSYGESSSLDHIEMTIHIEDREEHILQRLTRERRCGWIECVDKHTYRFVADVFDAVEMLPWIRTFIGRIARLESSNQYVVNTFYQDFEAMCCMYGDDDAI